MERLLAFGVDEDASRIRAVIFCLVLPSIFASLCYLIGEKSETCQIFAELSGPMMVGEGVQVGIAKLKVNSLD